MSYLSPFEHSFCAHTLKVLEDYKGEYEVTNLVNCLLGLLVVPQEAMLKGLPEESFENLELDWGICISAIKCVGKKGEGPEPESIRGLVYNLRNSVAHFLVKPEPETENVEILKFGRNKNGFYAEIPVHQLNKFVRELAARLTKL